MSKYVSDTAAAKALDAYVILKGKRKIATVLSYRGSGGRVLVNVFSRGAEFQHGSASGYGYDKFTAALRGLSVDGHAMSDHCEVQRKPPRGRRFFPADYKPPRGYSLANYGQYEAETGQRRDSYYWRDAAEAELGSGAAWEDVQRRAAELKAAANLVGGYSSCYREAGLRYLEARGYTVIQVL